MGSVYRVGVVAAGGTTSRHCPFPVYPAQIMKDFSIPQLPAIWQDFVGDGNGALMCIANAGWLRWLAMPEILPDGELKEFLLHSMMPKWAYVPVEAEGPRGHLIDPEKMILAKFDRVLAYTEFGSRVIGKALGKEIEHIPHGTDEHVFYPRDRERARKSEFGPRILKSPAGVSMEPLMIGVVATNSQRKDWPLAFETCAELLMRGEKVMLWAHTDKVLGYWDLMTMADEFGMHSNTVITTGNLSDNDLAWGYAACDVTLGIAPEGWGFPLSESLACGVPVVIGNYAGATEFVPEDFRVQVEAWRYDGFYCARRPVYRAADFADRVQWAKDKPGFLMPEFVWSGENGAWSRWESWLRKGLPGG
jgi:glycosyltransferase involved in cell wall biosynthesis